VPGLADLVSNLPLVISVVDAPEVIARLLRRAETMVAAKGGLITVLDVTAFRYVRPTGKRRQGGGVLRVRDVMERKVVTVKTTTPAAEILPLLLDKFYKALPVLDEQDKVVGIITDGDLLVWGGVSFRLSVVEALEQAGEQGIAQLLADLSHIQKTARDVMGTRPLVTVGPERLLKDAATLMFELSVKRVPVADRDGRLVGILGQLNVLKVAATLLPHSRVGTEGGSGGQRLAEVMDRSVVKVRACTPLEQAINELLGSSGARRLIVVDGDERPVGIVTDADLVTRVSEQARPGLLRSLAERLHFAPTTTTSRLQLVDEVMSKPVVTVPQIASLSDAIRLMIARGVKVLPRWSRGCGWLRVGDWYSADARNDAGCRAAAAHFQGRRNQLQGDTVRHTAAPPVRLQATPVEGNSGIPPCWQGLNSRQRELLAEFEQAGRCTMTTGKYMARFDLSDEQAKNNLVHLVERGLMHRHGRGRATRYVLVPPGSKEGRPANDS